MAVGGFDRKLVGILERHRLVPAADLELLFRRSEESGSGFCSELLKAAVVDERILIALVARELGIPPLDLDRISVESTTLALLPRPLAEYYRVLPVAEIEGVLTLAMSNPYDVLAMEALSVLTGCFIQPVISVEPAILRNVKRLYARSRRPLGNGEERREPRSAWRQLSVNRPPQTEKLVTLLVLYAVQVEAEQIDLLPEEGGGVAVVMNGRNGAVTLEPLTSTVAAEIVTVFHDRSSPAAGGAGGKSPGMRLLALDDLDLSLSVFIHSSSGSGAATLLLSRRESI